MRYALITDVHGNLEALTAALDAIDAIDAIDAERADGGVDAIVCLGDTVVYGADPEACCRLVRERAAICVLGNHDAAVCGRLDERLLKLIPDLVQRSVEHSAAQLSRGSRKWLGELPLVERGEGVTFCHGSPRRVEGFEYCHLPYLAQQCLELWDDLAPATFIGHSHLHRAFALTPDAVEQLAGERLVLDAGKKHIVNVRSAGQPRDDDNRTCFALFDAATRELELRRVSYDTEAAAAKIEAAGLAPLFARRVRTGTSEWR